MRILDANLTKKKIKYDRHILTMLFYGYSAYVACSLIFSVNGKTIFIFIFDMTCNLRQKRQRQKLNMTDM